MSQASDGAQDEFGSAPSDEMRSVSSDSDDEQRDELASVSTCPSDDRPHFAQRTYIPITLARKQLTRVVNDMVAMKERFTTIVKDLDTNYQAIELETGSQFRAYVDKLKAEMNRKVAALSQVAAVRA